MAYEILFFIVLLAMFTLPLHGWVNTPSAYINFALSEQLIAVPCNSDPLSSAVS